MVEHFSTLVNGRHNPIVEFIHLTPRRSQKLTYFLGESRKFDEWRSAIVSLF
jgi:hypothetical protein